MNPHREPAFRPDLVSVFRMLLGLVIICDAWAGEAATTLVPAGSVWKYLDNGSDQGTPWRATGFNDSSWKSGPAQLGYGDGDETTLVSYGPNPNNRYITTYFRHAFTVADPASYTGLTLRLLRDDGAVVYLNGVEAFRSNMPVGAIGYQSLAATALGGADEQTFVVATIPLERLASGVNVLAVEVHQASATSSDVSFDLELSVDLVQPAVTLVSPADGATWVATSPALQVQVTDPVGDPLGVTFYGRVRDPAAEEFRIVVLPDTQNYTLTDTAALIFSQQTQWIVDNRDALHIVFVSHEGDIADLATDTVQWERADRSMSILDGSLPYGLAPGNHDQPTTLYNQRFPYTRYQALSWYGGHYPANGNDNNFEVFSAGGIDFILLQLQFAPTTSVLAWAEAVLEAHADRKAIITTHGFLGPDGSRNVSVLGSTQYIWDALVVPHDNVYFVLCGHESGEVARTDMVNGRKVHQLLADYQDLPEGGQGWLRILRFVPAENRVSVQTYSPHLNTYQTDANSEFALEFPMADFAIIGAQPDVVSGAIATVPWPGLNATASYEWYVTVTNSSGGTTKSPVWQFTTRPVNHPPVATPQTLTTLEDASMAVALSGRDVDGDQPLTYAVVDGPCHGTLNGQVPTLTYTPVPDYFGPDAFLFVVNDGLVDSAPATVAIAVIPVNDPPGFQKGPDIEVLQNTGPQTTPTWASAISPGPGESTQTVEFIVSPDKPYLFSVPPAIDASGNLSFTPAQNLRGTALVTVWLWDNGGRVNGGRDTSLPQTFTITVGSTTDSNRNGLPDDWEMAYGHALDPPCDAGADEDGDGFTNLQEYAAGTDPRNPSSSPGITDIAPAPAGLMISFKTVLGKRYAVDYQDGDLDGSWSLLADGVNGTGAIAQAIDETAESQARRFYRIRLLP